MLGYCITTSASVRNTKVIQCIFHIENKRAPKCSPKRGHPHLVKYGFRIRDFVDLPIGGKKVILRMKVRHYKCKCADYAMIARNGYLLPPAVTVIHSQAEKQTRGKLQRSEQPRQKHLKKNW